MKTLRIVLSVAIFCLCVLPALSQEAAGSQQGENWSNYYYIRIPLEKVYQHQLGYVVLYQSSGSKLQKAYLPLDWFNKVGGKGALIRMRGGMDWPYMTIYYKEGKFDHMILYVRGENFHESWGMLPPQAAIDDEFNVEELSIKF